MSFSTSLRWVLNDRLPVKVRVHAFCWVIESFCWLTHSSFQEVLADTGRKHSFDLQTKPDIDHIVRAAKELEQIRSAFLLDVSAYRNLRRQQKTLGIRRPLRAVMDPRGGRP